MNKFKFTFLLIISAFIAFSCSGPVTETKIKIKNIEKYTEFANKASADLNIQKEEAEELNSIAKEIIKAENKFTSEYKSDETASTKILKYQTQNKNEIKTAYDNFTLAIINLSKCKGYEQLILE